MSKSWGTPTWYFFHTLAEKIKENEYDGIKKDVLLHIKNICSVLPCPDCRLHATHILNSYRFYHIIKSKNEFKKFLFEFHNLVNSRTGKSIQNKLILDQYKNYNFRTATADWYNHFTVNTYDVKLIWEKKERNKVRSDILSILHENIKHFSI